MIRFFIISLFLLTSVWYNAQTIQLGAGTGESWNQNSSPVNIYYRRSVCQMVYTAEELNEVFASSINPITEMGFYITESPIYRLRQYTIKFKHVTVNNVANALGTTGWTEVKSAFNYMPTAGGFDMIALDVPFLWNGVDNIGVEICWSRVTPTWDASGTVRIYGTQNGYRYSWNDNNGSMCGTTPTTVTTDKPQVQFVFVGGTTTTWTGAIDTDWFDAGNWTAGIPNPIMDAIIPGALSNYPLIIGSGAICKDITIESGATLEISNTDSLTVIGNWSNNGLFTPNESTILFKGFGGNANELTGNTNQDFFNLEVRSEAGVSLISGSYNIYGNLRLRGGTFTSNNLVTLKSNANNTGRLTRISNFCDYQLEMDDTYGDGWNGGYLKFRVDGDLVDYYNAEGNGSTVSLPLPDGATFSLEYNAGRYENENSYNLFDNNGTLIFSDGTNPSTGIVFTSVASCPFSNNFLGDLAVERHLNLTSDGWREMSAGVSGQTLNDWQNDGLIMANFQGSNYPNFGWTSVYTYEENNANGVKEDGWVEAQNITDALDYNRGHRVYIGTGQFTTSINGAPHTGDISIPLDYQNITSLEIAANENQKGWNLIGNPYACTLNWDSIDVSDKINVDDAIWIWSGDAGNYGVYVGGDGTGTNNVSGDIASSQAFWVHANSTGASLAIREEDKTEINKTFVKNSPSPILKIRLTSTNNTYSDEVVLKTKSTSNEKLDQWDAFKLSSYLLDAPQLYFIEDNQWYLSINSKPDPQDFYSLSLGVITGSSGSFSLDFEDFSFLEQYPCIILEDKLLDIKVDLLANNSYSFNAMNDTIEDRFVIHYSTFSNSNINSLCKNYSDIQDKQIINFNIYPNPTSGLVNIQSSVLIDQIQVFDITGKVILIKSIDNLMTTLDLGHLASGMYTIQLYTSKGIMTKKLQKD